MRTCWVPQWLVHHGKIGPRICLPTSFSCTWSDAPTLVSLRIEDSQPLILLNIFTRLSRPTHFLCQVFLSHGEIDETGVNKTCFIFHAFSTAELSRLPQSTCSALTRPPYLKARGRLDLGFTCFSLFCQLHPAGRLVVVRKVYYIRYV